MNQELLDKYDTFIGSVTEELYEEFLNPSYLEQAKDLKLACRVQEWLESQETKHTARLFAVAKEDPDTVMHLLSFLQQQFVAYELVATTLKNYHQKLFEDDNGAEQG